MGIDCGIYDTVNKEYYWCDRWYVFSILEDSDTAKENPELFKLAEKCSNSYRSEDKWVDYDTMLLFLRKLKKVKKDGYSQNWIKKSIKFVMDRPDGRFIIISECTVADDFDEEDGWEIVN